MHQKTVVKQASLTELPLLTTLFDQYRQFYKQPSQPLDCAEFLKQRMTLNESILFLATQDATAVGFIQLYPSFSSIGLRKLLILNDLFVAADFRKKGIAQLLINSCTEWAKEEGYRGLTLKTAKENFEAQNLYKKLGWIKDEKFDSYQLIFESFS